jgi:fumarate hydratase class II
MTTFADVIKAGRTHLQDATPITLGQEFSGYATQIRRNIERIERGSLGLLRLALGGTAVGSGLNTHPLFAEFAIREIVAKTGFPFVETENHFEAQASMDVAVEVSGQLKTLAISMMKIANDLRLLSSGPRCGFGEISLPAFAPGSSIMPGKVNPVVCEMVLMVSAQVIGNDSTITVCGQHGNLELHTMMPVLAYNLLQSIELLASISRLFAESCISGIEADRERCLAYAESSLSVVTALAPTIGYEKAATVAREAMRQGRSIKEVARDLRVVPTDEVGRLCDVRRMTGAGL